jgi:hypothetical protein
MEFFSKITSSVKSNYANLAVITISASVIVGVITVFLVARDLVKGGK